jgi:hypothetical protein
MFIFNPSFPDATNEQKWEQIKLWRNTELASTDWTMISDAPTDKVAWAKYRQALRDLPAQGGLADKAKFPAAPKVVDETVSK